MKKRGKNKPKSIGSLSLNDRIKIILILLLLIFLTASPWAVNFWHSLGKSLPEITGKAITESNPILHYNFEDNANDISGNNNNGQESGEINYENGLVGKALKLTKGDNKIAVPNSESFPSDEITIMLWIKTTSAVRSYLTSKYETESRNPYYKSGYILDYLGNSDEVRLATGNDKAGMGIWLICKGKNIKDNEWHHITALVKGGIKKIYIDRTLCAEEDTGNNRLYNERDLEIGKNLDGLIDELKIWDYALSEQEILAEYEAERPVVYCGDAICQSDEDCSACPEDCGECEETPLESQPITHYSFEDISNRVATDSEGNNDGLIFKNEDKQPKITKGIIGNAVEFDGDDFIYVKDSETLSPDKITISAWIKSDTWEKGFIVYKHDNSPISGYSLRKDSVGAMFLASGKEDIWAKCTEDIQNGKWHHITATAKTNGKKRLYIDGELCDEKNTGSEGLDSRRSMLIGYLFQGSIDELKIWNYELDSDVIKQEYEKNKPESYALEEPVLYLTFDEITENKLIKDDARGNFAFLPASADKQPKIVEGLVDNAIQFDGNDYLSVFDNKELSPNQITLSAWIKSDSDKNGYIVYKFDKNPYPGYSLKLVNTKSYFWAGGKTGGNWLACQKNLADGKWHYLTATAETGGDKKIYVDGKFCSEGVTGQEGLDSEKRLFLGNNFNGLIDELKIWDYVLSEQEIQSEYDENKPPVESLKFTEKRVSKISDNPDVLGSSIAMEGNLITWTYHGVPPKNKIYYYDLSSGKINLIPYGTGSVKREITINSEGKILWVEDPDSRDGDDILLYEPSSGLKETIPVEEWTVKTISISEDKLVYETSERNIGNERKIYLYDLSTKERKVIHSSKYHSFNPAIYGDKVVFVDSLEKIYLYDLKTGRKTELDDFVYFPDINKNKVVWARSEDRIYMYDLTTNKKTLIASDSSKPKICDDKIVYESGRNGNLDIFLYDLSTDTETQITDDPSDQVEPIISGNRIAWIDHRNNKKEIYMAEFE